MLKNFLIIVGLLLAFPVFSQEGISLKGRIEMDSLVGPSIHIINITQETGTVNLPSGEFEIEVRENDTLLFSSVQYGKLKIKITSEILKAQFLQVSLTKHINELEEVNISNINLSGNLESDISGIPTFNKFDLNAPIRTKPPPTAVERRIYTATNSGGGLFSVSLDNILNRLNGKLKMLKKVKENEDLSFLIQKGIAALPKQFFLENLNLSEEKIIDFVYYCAEDSQFENVVSEDKKLELIELYTSKVGGFRNLNSE